ncbi:MAG: isopenicillin N synthase family dioxygenase [Flavobacteriaceae bacterium]
MENRHIPQLNLDHFTGDDPSLQQKFVEALGDAFSEIGFVAISGELLDWTTIDRLYEQVQLFFGMPQSIKDRYTLANGAGQRGYTAFGKESAKGQKVGDLKEFWHFGPELPPNSPYAAVYPKNIQVDELASFNLLGQKCFQLFQKIAAEVLRALARYLSLPDNYFVPYITEGNSILRAIHYPPIRQEPQNALRAAAHGDINLITLLVGAQGAGLQVQNRQGQWVDATAEADQIMINIGDMLSRLSNNRLRSTIHRVVNPPREKWHLSRFSIPFFLHPVPDMPLNCLEHLIDEKHPKSYADCTAGEFLDERLKELGLKS